MHTNLLKRESYEILRNSMKLNRLIYLKSAERKIIMFEILRTEIYISHVHFRIAKGFPLRQSTHPHMNKILQIPKMFSLRYFSNAFFGDESAEHNISSVVVAL